MANLKELRNRIASVKSTQQVTRAMKMVSAAKLRKAQDAIIQFRPYAGKLQEIMVALSTENSECNHNCFSDVREPQKILIVAIGSNRGLCGGFNANITRKIFEMVENKYARQYNNKSLDIIILGKKIEDGVKAKKIRISKTNHDLLGEISFINTSRFAEMIMDEFIEKKYDKVELVYNRFKNSITHYLTVEQFLPIELPELAGTSEQMRNEQLNTIFEPSKEEVMKMVIPKSLKTQFYKAFLDSAASEHGASYNFV